MLSELENDIREEKFKKYIKYNEGRSETWEFFLKIVTHFSVVICFLMYISDLYVVIIKKINKIK